MYGTQREWGNDGGEAGGVIPITSEHILDGDPWCRATNSSPRQRESRFGLVRTASSSNPSNDGKRHFPWEQEQPTEDALLGSVFPARSLFSGYSLVLLSFIRSEPSPSHAQRCGCIGFRRDTIFLGKE